MIIQFPRQLNQEDEFINSLTERQAELFFNTIIKNWELANQQDEENWQNHWDKLKKENEKLKEENLELKKELKKWQKKS